MGVADWLVGVKCADCGLKIQGPKFSRMILGSEYWVCAACEEKRKAELKKERDASGLLREEELASAIRERSDEEIAEVLTRNVLKEYAAFLKEMFEATGGTIELNDVSAFTFVLSVTSRIFLSPAVLPLDAARIAHIEGTLARYALAGFIHGTFRNIQPGFAAESINRAALLSELVARYPQVSDAHRQRITAVMNVADKDPKALIVLLGSLFADHIVSPPEKFAEFLQSDTEKRTRLFRCILNILVRTSDQRAAVRQYIAAITPKVNRAIAVELPDSWLLKQTEPWLLYCDPGTPQYNLHITVRASLSKDTPIEALRRVLLMNAPDTEPVELGPARAIAQYRITSVENGEAKDDRHWVLVDKQDERLHYALFTLSVLAGRADSAVTETLVETLASQIQHAQFLPDSRQ